MSNRSSSSSPPPSPEVFVRIESPMDIEVDDGCSTREPESLVVRPSDPMPCVLEWQHLCLKVEVSTTKVSKDPAGPQQKTILDDLSGAARSGELLVLMGPSGAGKTSLLDCLAGRNRGATGRVAVNGVTLNANMKAVMTYVVQDDLFYETLTVREHLIFQGKLRLGDVVSNEEVVRRVDKAMPAEILGDPLIFFVDEPTSGLDSFMAESVVMQLQRIARQGKTVLTTIHQPSSDIFARFDRLYLMANGSVVYDGPAKDALDYFNSQGYPCPAFSNPAEHFMRQLAVLDAENDRAGAQRVQTLIDSWKKSQDMTLAASETGQSSRFTGKSKHLGGVSQTLVLLQRNVVRLLRDKLLLRVSMMQSFMTAVIVGLVYLQLDLGQTGVQNFVGVFFFMVVSQTMITANGQSTSVPLELTLIAREYQSGLYHVTSWYLAKNISELPMQIILPMVFFVPVYFMIGIGHGAPVYMYQQIIVILVHSAAVGFGYMIPCICQRADIAPTIGIVLLMPMVLLAGLLINSEDIPVYLIWLEFLSPLKYGFEGLMKVFWSECRLPSGGVYGATLEHQARQPLSLLPSIYVFFSPRWSVNLTSEKSQAWIWEHRCLEQTLLVEYIANTMDTSPDFLEQMNYVILASRNNASKAILDSVLKKSVWLRRRKNPDFDEQVDNEDSMSSAKLDSTPQMLGKRKFSQVRVLSKRHRQVQREDDSNSSDEEKKSASNTGKELQPTQACKQHQLNGKGPAAPIEKKSHPGLKTTEANEDEVGDLCLLKPKSPGQFETIKTWIQKVNELIDAKYCEPPVGYICSRACIERQEQMTGETGLCGIWKRVEEHLAECESLQCEIRTRFNLQKTTHLIELKQVEIGEVRHDLKAKRVNWASAVRAGDRSSHTSELDFLEKKFQIKNEELTALERKKDSLCAKMDSIRLDWRDEFTGNPRNTASHYVRDV
ncbi:ABC transporter-like protein [Phytophthora cinnamomi]|uniref:ABC transporter-like protein n=1 Tax=Phytophthora cinnamomi TaxID=4785 RepID=UPI00355A7BAF|nr:ABC transporter-like protein [Phytophthora cinnamomi]